MTAENFGSGATTSTAAVNGGDQGCCPIVARSRGGSSGNMGARSRFFVLNKQEDVQAVDETANNGNEAVVCVTEDAATDRRWEVDKGKEPMRASTQAGMHFGPKVNASHATLSDGLKGAWEVDHAESAKLATKADGPKKNKERVLNDITNNWSLGLLL